jgi:hypothetical protein
MKRFKSIAVAACAVLVAVALTLPAAPVSAQSSSALSIVPKKNYLIEPGKSVKDTLVIRNLDTVHLLQLTLRVVDFTFTDDGGTPKLFLAADAPQTTWSLKPYMTVPKSVTIPPSSSKTLDMSVAIPASRGAGSLYSAIIYSSGTPDPTGVGNVGLSASGVTLVFTQIPGKVNEDLKLKKFGAYSLPSATKKADYVFMTTQEPLNVAYTLENKGNVTEAPVGSITLNGWFGQTRTINNVNPTGSLALIGQTRTYTACIKLKDATVDFNGKVTKTTQCDSPGLWPGMYTASLDLFYGQNGNNTQEITSTAVFWYLPLWFIVILVIVLLILAYVGWRVYNFVQTKLYGRPSRRSKKSPRRK